MSFDRWLYRPPRAAQRAALPALEALGTGKDARHSRASDNGAIIRPCPGRPAAWPRCARLYI